MAGPHDVVTINNWYLIITASLVNLSWVSRYLVYSKFKHGRLEVFAKMIQR